MPHLTGGRSGDTALGGQPPLGRFSEVDGRRLLLHQEGSGGPPVVFLPGGGAVGLDYWNVQHQAAELTTSVVYDRAGATASIGRAPGPR